MSSQLSFFEGRAERDRILQHMSENHRVYLEALRSFARVVALREGRVTIDDVRDEMERVDFPMPSEIGADNRVLGAVFKTKDFRAVKQEPTRRQERIGRSGLGASFVWVYELRSAA